MDNIKELYKEYKNKIDDLMYGIVKDIQNESILIDLNEINTKAILKIENDIAKNRIYSDGDMIYGCISSVSIEDGEVVIFIDRKSNSFIEKLIQEQASYMDINSLEIKNIKYIDGSLNIYLDEVDDKSYYESSLDSVMSIIKEELNLNSIELHFGDVNEVSEGHNNIGETIIVDNIDLNIEKGSIVNHKDYGVCKVIFKLELEKGSFIGLQLNDNKSKVIYID